MKITITLNGVKVEKNIPITWGEVTFGQFLKLSKAKNDLSEILSVFTDIDPETLRKAEIRNLSVVTNVLSFIETEKFDLSLPKTILGYKMPENLEIESIGQFEDLKLEAAEVGQKGVEKYAVICAIYATNPYDHAKAEELSKEFHNAPCQEVMAIGNFTLMKLTGLKLLGENAILSQNSRMMKLKLAMISYLARLAFTVRYYLWKRKLNTLARSY